MASTDLKLIACGSLPKTGPIGRVVRMCFGFLCLYYIFGLWDVRHDLLTEENSIRPLVWNGVLPALFLMSYAVNIGFSRAWKKWPAIGGVGVTIMMGAYGYLQTGHFETMVLAKWLLIAELYVFSHLGISFILAALLATPGCEMRAIHHFYSMLFGTPTKEHHCPIGPLRWIDKWEYGRRRE